MEPSPPPLVRRLPPCSKEGTRVPGLMDPTPTKAQNPRPPSSPKQFSPRFVLLQQANSHVSLVCIKHFKRGKMSLLRELPPTYLRGWMLTTGSCTGSSSLTSVRASNARPARTFSNPNLPRESISNSTSTSTGTPTYQKCVSVGEPRYQMMDLSTTSVLAAKAYKYKAESLVKEYLLADSYVSYTAVLGGILMCKMAYDITSIISLLYYKGYGSLTKTQKLEWNNRAMSTIHAIFITVMSVYLVSVGYFIADLAMIFWAYPSLGGMEYVLHHMLSLISVVFAMYSGEGQLYTYMCLISETTTPGINLRWFLDTAGMKKSKAYLVNGVTMFVAWLVARIILFVYLFYHIYFHYDQVKQMHTFSCILVFSVPTILLVMNIMWFAKILRGLKKTLAKRQ